jgi:hypothetical protein
MNGISKSIKLIAAPVIKHIEKYNYVPYIVTSLGVRMRNPTDKDGKWIGWTGEEVAEHLQSVKTYVSTLPPEKPQNGRGC